MRGARTTLIVAACAVIGVVVQLVEGAIVLELDDAGTSALPPGEELQWAAYLGGQVLLGLLALVLLPIALRHEPPDREPCDAPGPPEALVAGVIVAGSGTVSALGVAAGLVAMVSVFSRGSWRWSLAAALAVTTGWVGDLLLAPGPRVAWWQALLVLLGLLMIAAVIGRARLGRRREQWQLQAAASMSREEMRTRELQAIEEERRRISRDMHDSLSHRLSLVAVHAGVLEVRDDLAPDDVRKQASILREQAELGVADLRAVLTALREEPDAIDPRTSIDELVASAQAAGAEVRYARHPQVTSDLLEALPSAAVHTLRRAVQEGLTNARKHAPGEPVDIELGRDGERVELTMTNRVGAWRDVDRSRGGVGLIGLEERARLAGGRVSSAVHENTFVLKLELPSR